MQIYWFTALLCSICLEGLGRRYLQFIPSPVFYFLKDIVLLIGYLNFRPPPGVSRTASYLYRGFGFFWGAAFLWTLLEMLNPENYSLALGFIGLRSYWLWWLAPVVIANVLQDKTTKNQAIYVLLALVVVVSGMAVVQFLSPTDSSVNMYAVWNGEEIYAADNGIVASTGRARVASTFAYISGFSDFTALVPALLLSLGLDAEDAKVRRAAFAGTFAAAIVVPMSGSRSSIVIGLAILGLTFWKAGLFFTRIGRRILVGSVVAAVLAVTVFPDAFLGVQSRFDENPDETKGRFEQLATYLPPLAIATFDYPAMGLGTGMQQNARAALHAPLSKFDTEMEAARYLVELGPAGFVLVWCAKLGLAVALLRSSSLLSKAGRRGSAAAALSYAALTMVGNLAFDHNWQALYFVGCGFILADVIEVRRRAAMAQLPRAAGGPAAVSLEVAVPARVA